MHQRRISSGRTRCPATPDFQEAELACSCRVRRSWPELAGVHVSCRTSSIFAVSIRDIAKLRRTSSNSVGSSKSSNSAGRTRARKVFAVLARQRYELKMADEDEVAMFFFTKFIDTSDEDSSDDDSEVTLAAAMSSQEEPNAIPRFRGSIPSHETLDRNRVAGHIQLYNDYFNHVHTLYTPTQFRRRFRMRRDVFNRIVLHLEVHNNYFKMKPNACSKLGFSAIQKCTTVVRMLAYGVAGDLMDEHVRMG